MIIANENIDTLRSLSQLFSASHFSKIIRNDDQKYVRKKIKKHFSNSSTYNKIFSFLYSELQTKYKSEYFYKNALLNELLIKKYSLNTSTVLNEFAIGTSIADFILLNGEVRIYEIKTDLDSLEKLDKQLNDYVQFANKVYIVTSSRHSDKIMSKYADSNIGIFEFTNKNTFKKLKSAYNNLEHFNHLTIFKTLRKNEYLEIINDKFGFIPDVPNTLIFKECLELSKAIDISEFQPLVCNKLKERKLKCPDLFKSEDTPYELKHICYTLNFSENEYVNFYNFLNTAI